MTIISFFYYADKRTKFVLCFYKFYQYYVHLLINYLPFDMESIAKALNSARLCTNDQVALEAFIQDYFFDNSIGSSSGKLKHTHE